MITITRSTLVESHHNIGSDDALNLHHILGRKEVLATVDVAAESATLLLNLPMISQREDLEAAAVGEQGALPAVEFMESSRLPQ